MMEFELNDSKLVYQLVLPELDFDVRIGGEPDQIADCSEEILGFSDWRSEA